LTDSQLATKCGQNDLEGDCYRQVRRLAAEYAGEIDRRFPRILRRVGGYNLDAFVGNSQPFNLAKLLVGSEGTLGLTLEAKLRLIELPQSTGLLVVQFSDLLGALAATPVILKHQPAAVEVLDGYILDSTRRNSEAARLRDFLSGDPKAILIIEFYGEQIDEVAGRLKELESDLRRQGIGGHYLRTTEPSAQARIWKLRKLALGLSMAEKGDAKAISFVEDTAVAAENLRDYIARFLAIIARHGTRAGVYAHASVGCLHVRPIIDLKTEVGVRQFEAIAAEVADLVLEYGGALSGEHGDGLVRSPFQEKMYGPVLYQAFRQVKQTFDPLGILNPGKIVDAPPLTSNLRYGPAYMTPDVPTRFDFSADGGLTRAAELCAGVGECRKMRGGMCPSYQATREERHCTRGRANALRLALTGQLGFQGLTDPNLHDALDLCLECKACKVECPTNVDMARLKAEFLNQYYQKHGLPWRNRLFGNAAQFSRWGSRLAPFSSWILRSQPARWLNEKLLGIDRRRKPPFFARRTFFRQFSAMCRMKRTKDAQVLLFVDTFTNYYEPAVGLAAVSILEDLGCDLSLGQDLVCCGRPLISSGMLTGAVEHARHNVRRLYPWAAAGRPIVACEPSCILTLKDDYPALLRGEERRQAEAVSQESLTVEEFLEQRLLGSSMSFSAGPKNVLVQGHCHQRALVGMDPVLRLLRRIPKTTVVDLEAGCCGMAGSFGYEREHYEVSRLVGEQRLFPALRQSALDDVVVASGFSCRRQIEHFTGRAALHPIELIASLRACRT
jgi:Fe-S oxidoreductase